MINKQELQTELEALQAKIEQIKNKMKSPEYVVGKWYFGIIYSKTKYLMKYAGLIDDLYSSIEWIGTEGRNTNRVNFTSIEREAADEEIKSALVKHCELLGIKEGVRVDRSGLDLTNLFFIEMDIYCGDPDYCNKTDTLYLCGVRVYKNGKFATVVKPKPLTVGGHKVVVVGKYVTINGKCYKESLDNITEMIESGRINSVTIQGEVCDLEKIKAIRSLIK